MRVKPYALIFTIVFVLIQLATLLWVDHLYVELRKERQKSYDLSRQIHDTTNLKKVNDSLIRVVMQLRQ